MEWLLSPCKLDDKQKKKIVEHKYMSSGSSLLDPYMANFWNKCINYIPLWISPNMITLIGLFINLGPVLWILALSDTSQPLSPYLLFLCSLTIFIYQTLDALDGKQARRLSMGSPLGELFDHGCDSLSTFFLSIIVSASMIPKNHELILFTIGFLASLLFYLTHWQAFVTGKLYFTKINVTEAQITIILACLLPLFTYPEVFHLKVFGMTLIQLFIFPCIVNIIVSIVEMIHRICTLGAGKEGSSVANTSVLTPVLPIIAIFFGFTFIHSNTKVNIIHNHLYGNLLLAGLCFAKLSLKILISLMTKSAFNPFDSYVAVILIPVVNLYFEFNIQEEIILYFSIVRC